MWPGQTTPGKSNSTASLSTGSKRERERDIEEESGVCILLKRLSCQVNTSQKWEGTRNRGVGVSFSPETKDERPREREKNLRGNEGMSAGLCSPTKFTPLMCISCLSHQHVEIKKQAEEAQPLTRRTNTRDTEDCRDLFFYLPALQSSASCFLQHVHIYSSDHSMILAAINQFTCSICSIIVIIHFGETELLTLTLFTASFSR